MDRAAGKRKRARGEDLKDGAEKSVDKELDKRDSKYESKKEADLTAESSEDDDVLSSHLQLLERKPGLGEVDEIRTTPIFTESVRRFARSAVEKSSEAPFTQYGLLAGDVSDDQEPGFDSRIFYNVSAPSSVFICGNQGSGKSHSLSCLLENCLIKTAANELPHPLTGVVFHYDTFISDTGGAPCEVAWLSSDPHAKVRVLCPPTNIRVMKNLYGRFPSITVEELRLRQSDLNTKRMLDLMAVNSGQSMPLYLHVVSRILRDLRIEQQHTGSSFDYPAFKQRLDGEILTREQLGPLKQRLETLESFMVESQVKAFDMFAPKQMANSRPKKASPTAHPQPAKTTAKPGGCAAANGTNWTPQSGQLTIVDLSCPCVTAEAACGLFNICLSLFLEQDAGRVGRVVALDEAHKYITGSDECAALTESLLATIRLQRHLGVRVIISTQEPTVSPKLLDLCSVTVVHRFTSPDWLRALKRHLAGVASGSKLVEAAERMAGDQEDEEDHKLDGMGGLTLGSEDPTLELLSKIVGLNVGEALLFAPSAIVGVRTRGDREAIVRRLANGVLKVRVRNRTTADGGQSIMAV